MKAIVQDRYGPADLLEFRDIEEPVVGEDEVGVRGRDLAGTVQVVGSSVEGFRPGDEVMGIAEGSFAELAIASPDKLVPKPGMAHLRAGCGRSDLRPLP